MLRIGTHSRSAFVLAVVQVFWFGAASSCHSADYSCPAGTIHPQVVIVQPCAAVTVPTVRLSGVCAGSESESNGQLGFGSDTPGNCHVEIAYANGSTYMTDVEFSEQWVPGGGNPHGCGERIVPVGLSSDGLSAAELLIGPQCSGAGDAARDIDAPESAACATAQDCLGLPVTIANGEAVTCCINQTCIFGQAANDAAAALSCADAAAQLIQASTYDQSCQTDSDCIAVAEGDFCIVGNPSCTSATISKSACSRYQADVSKTNVAICRQESSCPCFPGRNCPGPCCRGGLCRVGTECSDSAAAPEGGGEADSGDRSPG